MTEKKQIPLTEARQTTSRETSRATPLFGSNSASDDDNGGGRISNSSEEDRGGKAHGRTLTRLTQVVRTIEKDSQVSVGPPLSLEAGKEWTLGCCVFGESQRSVSRPPPSPERYPQLARNTHTPRKTQTHLQITVTHTETVTPRRNPPIPHTPTLTHTTEPDNSDYPTVTRTFFRGT